MKTLLLSVALLIVCSFAKAETITLSPTPCASTYICFNVKNDASPSVAIAYLDYSAKWGRVTINMDGTNYDSGIYSAPTNLLSVPLYSPNGESVVYATLVFSAIHKPCVREGKVTICPVIVTLTSGTIEK